MLRLFNNQHLNACENIGWKTIIINYLPISSFILPLST